MATSLVYALSLLLAFWAWGMAGIGWILALSLALGFVIERRAKRHLRQRVRRALAELGIAVALEALYQHSTRVLLLQGHEGPLPERVALVQALGVLIATLGEKSVTASVALLARDADREGARL